MNEPESGKERSSIVNLDDEQAVKQVVGECVLGLWDVVNNLTRLRPVKHERYRVTIFGSARTEPGSEGYDEVRRLARELAQMGCDIITGGGPGMMRAANEGAVSAGAGERDQSIGIRVDLDSEQGTNPFVGLAYEHQTFFSRLHHFVLLSDAFVVVRGGIGTTLETMMIWQLLQVRKLYGTPLILIGKMWAEMVAWARTHMLGDQRNLAHPVDMEIPSCVDGVDEALELIRQHHSEWKRR